LAERLGRTSPRAEQLSARGGTIGCGVGGDRVILTGHAALYMTAEIHVPESQP
jgi:hypothetical protein